MAHITYTKEQVEAEKRDAGPALYDALYRLLKSMEDDHTQTIGGASRGQELRHQADKADEQDAALAAAWKTLHKIHQAGLNYRSLKYPPE